MLKQPKRIIKKVANQLLADLAQSINDIQARVGTLEHKNAVLLEKTYNSGTIQVSEREIVTKIFTGLKIYLDPRDISVTPHLALDGIYEGDISNAWLSLLKPEITVMDIGANFGYFGALAAQKTNPKKSKVIYFEANPKLIPYIRKTLGVNWINQQSIVENLALSDIEGKVTLNVFKDHIGSSSLHSPQHIDEYMHNKMYIEVEEKVQVQATTLDAYCQKHNIGSVDLIKMDIEGFEEKAYQGMRNIVKASPNLTMFIEFTKQSYENPKQFYEQLLKDFGYVYTINSGGHLTRPDKPSYDSLIEMEDDWAMPVFSKNGRLADR